MQSSYSSSPKENNKSESQNTESCGIQEYGYAGFWVRLAAYVLDSVVVFFALLAVRLAVSGVMAAAKDTVLAGNLLFQYNLKDIVLYVSEALYFILCTYYTGTTLGKKAMNLRVVRADGGEKLGLFTVVYRETVGRFLCSVIMGAGYLMAGIDKEKRGLHDILCDTRVIYAKKVKVFKMETAFTPIAEPMGRVPVQEEASQTYSMRAVDEASQTYPMRAADEASQTYPMRAADEASQPYSMRAVDEASQTYSVNAAGETLQQPENGASHMPWDAPYTKKDNDFQKAEVLTSKEEACASIEQEEQQDADVLENVSDTIFEGENASSDNQE